MKNPRVVTALGIGLVSVWLMSTAQADEWDKKTTITISEPVQLPTVVLQPGTYVMKLLNSASDRHVVQVFDKDQKEVITTIMAIPNYRLQPTGKSEFDFWEVPAGQPRALRAWFYPGDSFGQEFEYPKNLSAQIASYTHVTVPTASESPANIESPRVEPASQNAKSAELHTRTPTQASAVVPRPIPTPAPLAARPEPEPQPVQLAQATPPPAPQPLATPSELPRTASFLPLVGLIGLASLAAFGLTLGRKSIR